MQLVGSVLALVLVVVIDGFVDSLIRESGALGILRAEAVKDNCEAASGWGIAEGAGKKWGGPRPEAVGFRGSARGRPINQKCDAASGLGQADRAGARGRDARSSPSPQPSPVEGEGVGGGKIS